jgi:DNA replication and repair protein RecF
MSNAPHAITSLTLEHFRNYRTLTLNLKPQPVVLSGLNGAGKTNILEAISLLAPGRGMRSARLREMDSLQGQGAPWVVAAEIRAGTTTTQIGTGRDGESTMEKRILKINGERERRHSVLTQHACIQWLTPSMDQVFVEGGSARRKLLDRMVFGFDPDHANRVVGYETAMRERNKLLSDRSRADPHWLTVLETQMGEHGVAMTLARLEALQRLQEHLNEPIGSFPRAQIALHGLVEGWLEEGMSALNAESKLAGHLRDARMTDAVIGRASLGPHRSHFHVIHNEKNMPAERCSTGEQKALLLSLVLAAARARATWCGLPPILLLDEVVAHLDVDKRGALFDLIKASKIQAWMTGTDAADFQGLGPHVTRLEIAGARARFEVEI